MAIATAALLVPGLSSSEGVFTHVHNRVPQDQQAVAAGWYVAVFGGVPAERGPGPGIDLQNGFLGSMPFDGLAGDGAHSVIDHVAISVSDVNAAVDRIRDLGGKIRKGPEPNAVGQAAAQVSDPWGGRFELVEDSVHQGFDHVAIVASDADITNAWFLQVFGGESDEERGQGQFHAVRFGDLWIHIAQAAAGDERKPSRFRTTDHIGFIVPSLDSFRVTLKASGYEPYLERPNPPGADLMFIEGPDGIHIEMTEPLRP